MKDGVVPLLKPPGMSSSDGVVDIRRLFEEKKAGHLGTLDPGAAGVLPVCVGRAVKLFDYLVDKDKGYRFEIVFGAETDTQDVFGKITARSEKKITAEALLQALPAFTGTLLQKAPAYSALKSNGRKLYDIALSGQEVPEKIRPVTVRRLELIEQTGENRFLLDMVCTRGTYVRTLCSDLGKALGCCAHMGFLLRTSTGPFTIGETYTVEELKTLKEQGRLFEALVSCERALAHLGELHLPIDREIPAKNGLPTYCSADEGVYRLYCENTFLGVGIVRAGSVKLGVHLYE